MWLFVSLGLAGLVIKGALNGCEEHEHVTAFKLGRRFDRSVLFQVLRKTLEHIEPLLRMGHFAAAEHDGDLNACALLQETKDVTLLGLVIAHIDLGSELHFLDLDLGLVLTSLLGLHGLLVLELAVIHDPTHRGIRVGRNLHQVKPLFIGDALRIADAEETELRSIYADQTAGGSGDLVIDAGVIRLSYVLTSFLNRKK